MGSAALGEERAFRAFYDRHQRQVLGYCLRRADREDAYDAAAETFLVAWRRREDIPPEKARAWLFGVAYRVLANQRRRRKRQRRLLGRLRQVVAGVSSDAPDAAAVASDGTADVVAALERLSPTDRELLRLVAWEGVSREEVGEIFGCSRNAVDQRLYRARTRLERELSRKGFVRAGRREDRT